MSNYLIWIACQKSGSYRTFKQVPNRNTVQGVWEGDYDSKGQVAIAHLETLGLSLPSLTWEDEPVQLNISIVWESKDK